MESTLFDLASFAPSLKKISSVYIATPFQVILLIVEQTSVFVQNIKCAENIISTAFLSC